MQYVYIPYTSLWQYIRLYTRLRSSGTVFYLERAGAFSLIQLCGSLILLIYCILKIKKKAFFTALAFPFVLFAAAVPGSFPMTAAILGIFSAAYWIEAFGGEADILHKQFKKRLKQNYCMFILPSGAFVFALLSGMAAFFLFLLGILLSAVSTFLVYTFLQLYHSAEEDTDGTHHHFKILVMHPDSWKHFWNTKDTFHITVVTAVLLFITAISPLLFSTNRLPSAINTLSLPAPAANSRLPFTDDGFFSACKNHSEQSLPDITDYLKDRWYTAAFPYMNINEPFTPLRKNTVIQLATFEQQPDGRIKKKNHILYTFNTGFISRIIHSKSLNRFPLERMLIAQNGFFSAVQQTITLFIFNKMITCCICLAALFFPCVLIIIAKRQ